MVVLSIRNDRTGGAWRVWPDPEEIPPGAIREAQSYLFELSGTKTANKAELLIDDTPLEALRSQDPNVARWRWMPGFHVGTMEAELSLPGTGTRRFELVTDPDLRKLTREDFDTMVREILEDTEALFSLSSFRRKIARGTGGRPPAIARLEFIRSRIDEIEKTTHAIARRPRRLLAAEDTVVPYYRAFRVTGPEILKSFRSGHVLRETGEPARLPPALGGFLPSQLRLRKRRSSLDIPEHRQMAACLMAWSKWLSAVADLLKRGADNPDRDTGRIRRAWSARCRRLSRQLAQLLELPPFVKVSEEPPRLMLSSLFRNDPDYRQFFRLYQDMNLGIAAVFGDFLAMPLSRTFELYELWCFLRLVRTAVGEYGTENVSVSDLFINDAAGGVTLSAGAVAVAVGSGWKICFQKEYREFWLEPDRRGSFSRTMKPDIVMGNAGKETDLDTKLIVLDAKYRIDDGLNEALSSIHTYRDALVREAATGGNEGIVSAAYLLTPHLPELDTEHGFRNTGMPGRLFHPDYRQSFRFGAVTLRPGMADNELRATLRTIVADSMAQA